MLIGQVLTDVLVWNETIDMRKSIDGLCMVVNESIGENPSSGKVYVFFNKGLDKLKLIYWASNGFCLLYKRLEKGRFQFPKGEKSFLLNRAQLEILLSGLPVDGIDQRIYEGPKTWPTIVDSPFNNYA
jgi:transposase